MGLPLSAARSAGDTQGEPLFWNAPLATLRDEFASPDSGLTSVTAEARLAAAGPNRALALGRRPLALESLDRFRNPLLIVLLVASGLAALTGDVASFVIVATIIALSVVIDCAQQAHADRAIEALRRSVALRARVRRDGVDVEVLSEALVSGDRVALAAGDLVPADGRVLAARDLFVNQALLTGEPYPVEKRAGDVAAPVTSPVDAVNAVFAGTSVISGSAEILVVRTGRATQLGAISGALAARAPETAFERGLHQFGLLMLRLTVLLVLFVLVVNVLFHRPWLESILFALALAVGLTPELLPMIVTVTLTRGAIQLARERVVVKRSQAVYNLGAIDALCTDKTGTLTEARIALVRHLDADGADDEHVLAVAAINSRFETGLKSPLDAAILDHASRGDDGWRKLDEVPYDFHRRRVSVLAARDGERLLAVKGAPEDILALSTRYRCRDGCLASLSEEVVEAQRERIAALGSEGFRTLAVAARAVGPEHDHARVDDETELVYLGLLAFLDPPKASAGPAVRRLAAQGIALRILTGDGPEVARHLCRELDIPVSGVVTGETLAAMSDEALLATVETTTLFCRVTPEQKRQVIGALKRRGHSVGFLGDGINDATAMHAADVGISVDEGADVAKEAADVILLEHDLAVLADGVAAGRRAFANVVKYVLMGTSSNFGNMFSMAGAALVLPFLPMKPIQVLANNLLYDLSELGVPLDRVDEEDTTRPHRWDNQYVQRYMMTIGPVSSVFDFLTFWILYALAQGHEALFQTGWFVESLVTQTLVIFVIRTARPAWRSRPALPLALLTLGVVAVALVLPWSPLASPLGLVPLPPVFYALLAGIVAAYLAVVEVVKQRLNARSPRP
jgi:Mg2+-importing ATPase